MGRIVAPLRQMGASIDGRADGSLAPLAVRGRKLSAIDYQSPVASAQIKSALLLAGLRAEGTTSVTEPLLSRDHTELMLAAMGARIRRDGLTVSVEGGHELSPCDVEVPGDISSAAFWLVAASIAPGSEMVLENVGVNPTRTGVLDVLERMGADITRLNEREIAGEQVADLRVRAAKLTGTSIQGEVIPRLVDEIPILALAAACAEGTTLVRDAQELRVKESDRLSAIATELGKLGARIQEMPDGLIIEGGTRWHGARCESRGDHRIAMTLGLAALVTPQPVEIEGVRCTETSYPGFWETLAGLRA
ncbi:3-phosphoshikimate 1-carboxyvinyltransferase 1 [compost metagenome]